MSFVKSEESAKAAKLVGAIIVVFGLAAWRVAGAMGPPPKPAAATEAVGAATTAATAAPATAPPTADAKPEDDAVRLPKLVVASNLNPFRTIAPVEDSAPATAPGVAPSPVPVPTLSGTPAGPLAATPLAVAPPATTRPVPALPAVAPARAPLRVTGILAGPNGTAVLELGSESRVVSVGARLADGTVVLRIDPATVTVRRGKDLQTLDVGE